MKIMTKLQETVLNYLYKYDEKAKFRKSRGWVTVKCPYCDTSSNKSHFNIQLKEGQPIIYKCFRASCGVGGVLNKKVARKLNISDTKVLGELDDMFLANTKYHTSNEYYAKEGNYKLGEINDVCENYFKLRTGASATMYQNKFRIASSLEEFVRLNSKKITFMNNIKFLLEAEKHGRDFIYFFNDRYTMLYYREINGLDIKGKVAINKNSSILLKHKPYSVVHTGKASKLHNKGSDTLFLAEGIFDIINTVLFIAPEVTGTFIASTSFEASRSIIQEFSKYKYKPYIVIISDSDIDLPLYKFKILRYIEKRISDMLVLYNTVAKDFGDIRYSMKVERFKLK